jgi:hypothetical protein
MGRREVAFKRRQELGLGHDNNNNFLLMLGRGWEPLLINLSSLKVMSNVVGSEKVRIDGDDG